jgi:exopolyphosphatase/guanosine-5'-triphosphate,3'-diphosphate pyrophosphatase
MPMSRTLAIIDLGTNTFHLLIAQIGDRGYKIIYRERLAVKIGMGGINEGIITEAGLHRALVAIQSFRNTIDQMGIQNIYAFGTSALRNAFNRQEVVEKIKTITNIDVSVISGNQEAEFIFYGVTSALDLDNDKALVMDIGGGSVEFIIGNNTKVFWKESFEIGAQRLLERFQKHDPIIPAEIKALDQFFDETL